MFAVFLIYAFLGWCAEVAYAALIHGKFVNRGFLNGPVCPIYGFGALLALHALEPLRENWALLFAGSVLAASALELATGWALEKIFRRRWWDYSREPFNLGGYICLRFSLIWGFACVFVVDVIHPTVLALLDLIPGPAAAVLLVLSAAGMAVDLTATVRTIARMRRRQDQIDRLAERMRALSDEFGEQLAVRVMDAAETGGELRQELTEKAGEVRAEVNERADAVRAEMNEKAGAWKERGTALRERLEDRRETLEDAYARRLRQASEEFRELKGRLERLSARPVFGQNRLLDAYPEIRAALRERRRWRRMPAAGDDSE